MSPLKSWAAAAALLAVAGVARADDAGAPSLTRELVVATVKARLPEVSRCYQQALVSRPWLAGRLVVSFTVDGAGAVSRAEVERTELAEVRFLACALDAVGAWRFPRPAGGPADFSYPFVLGESGARDPSVLVDGRPRPAVLPARCTQAKECRELGLGLARGGPADQARAFEYLEAGCKLADGASCAGAAAALDFGRGVAKDRRRALASYERACARGAPGACATVAMFHALGVEGVAKKDVGKGVALLERACAAKDGVACLNLAARAAAGAGVPRDGARAAELRRRALELSP